MSLSNWCENNWGSCSSVISCSALNWKRSRRLTPTRCKRPPQQREHGTGRRVTFDWTITLGAVLVAATNLLGLLISGVTLYYKSREWVLKLHADNKEQLAALSGTIQAMEAKVDSLWEWFTTRLERRTNGP